MASASSHYKPVQRDILSILEYQHSWGFLGTYSFGLSSGATRDLVVGHENNGGGYIGDCFEGMKYKEGSSTLAEFIFATSSGQTFYDMSLVDGYNLPVGIVSLYQNVMIANRSTFHQI